jgi:transcriptional regulator with XRE-family HTH domain
MPRAPDPSSPAVVLGARMRARRELLGWSLEEFARKTRHHYTYLSRVELGKTNTSLELLCELAFALDIDLATLTHGLLPSGRQRRRRKKPSPGVDESSDGEGTSSPGS